MNWTDEPQQKHSVLRHLWSLHGLLHCKKTVLLVHTDHDAEHPGPVDNQREHGGRVGGWVVVLTCAFNKGVCPSMSTSAPNYGHVPVDMALKKKPARPSCLDVLPCRETSGVRLLGAPSTAPSEGPYHGERKRNPCPQSRSRTRLALPARQHEHATAEVDDERGHFPSNHDTTVSLHTVLLVHTGSMICSIVQTVGIDLCTTTGMSTTLKRTHHVTVILIHTCHDAEHLGPDDRKGKYCAKCIVTSKTNQPRDCPSDPYRP